MNLGNRFQIARVSRRAIGLISILEKRSTSLFQPVKRKTRVDLIQLGESPLGKGGPQFSSRDARALSLDGSLLRSCICRSFQSFRLVAHLPVFISALIYSETRRDTFCSHRSQNTMRDFN